MFVVKKTLDRRHAVTSERLMTEIDKRREKNEAMEAVRHVEAILRRWDPIGVAPGEFAPADEYDSYVPRIVSMLGAKCSVAELAAHLQQIRTKSIGLPADRLRDTICAEELVAWWKDHHAKR